MNNSRIIINTTNRFINLQNNTFHNQTNITIPFQINIVELVNASDVTRVHYYYDDIFNGTDTYYWNYYYQNTSQPAIIVQPTPTYVNFSQIGVSTYSLSINQSVLPYVGNYTHIIEAPPYSNISIVCDGFLKCPLEYRIGNTTRFNLSFGINIPQDSYGHYVDYIVLITDNKVVKINWNFDIYTSEDVYSYTVTEEDIAKCVTEKDLSLIECINILVNKSSTTVVNRTIYQNNTVIQEVVVPVIKFDYDTVQKLIGDKKATDAAIQQMAAERDIKQALEGDIAQLKAQMQTYQSKLDSAQQLLADERTTMDAELEKESKKIYDYLGIAMSVIVIYFILNWLYMTKTMSTHSLISELYFAVRRVI
jgi:hypothetical protein